MPKVLVIDDNPHMRRLLSRALLSEGHKVVTAEDGIDGAAKHHAESSDLTITVMDMPKQGR
jgi:CheY-like chemotaxis protein